MAHIIVAEKGESYETLRPKCIAIYGELQEHYLQKFSEHFKGTS